MIVVVAFFLYSSFQLHAYNPRLVHGRCSSKDVPTFKQMLIRTNVERMQGCIKTIANHVLHIAQKYFSFPLVCESRTIASSCAAAPVNAALNVFSLLCLRSISHTFV